MIEIKACPFCGHSGAEYRHDATIQHGSVKCGACKATGPSVFAASPSSGEEKAILRWNERRRSKDPVKD